VGNGAVFEKVLLVRNAFTRAADRLKHRGKYLIAIEQELDPATGYDRRIRVCRYSRIKGRFAENHARHLIDRGEVCATPE
jgi:hypothetical protein